MPSEAPLRVLFDGEAFLRHRRSGITRYLAETVAAFREDPSLGVAPLTPYRWVANAHLADRMPGTYHAVPLPGRVRRPALGAVAAPRRRGLEADLVHHSLYDLGALPVWEAPKRATTIYDFTFELFPDLFWDTSEELAAKRALIEASDVLLCISETTRRDLERFHPGLDTPVVVTPLAVGEEFRRPQPCRLPRLPERYVLHVGNRHAHKNVDLLFAAFARIAADDPDLRLVLCGNGLPDERDRLEQSGILERTLVLSASDAQLPWVYRGAAAFVFPSRYEGFGLPVLEAMASGAPVVSASSPALVEVADDAAGYFDPDDAGSLVDALRTVLADAATADRLRRLGRSRAADFTWQRTARATASAYRQAVG